MLKKLAKFNSFGKPEDFHFLLENLLSSNPKKIESIHTFCLNLKTFDSIPVKAIITLLCELSIVEIDSEERVYLTYFGLDFKKKFKDGNSLKYLSLLIVEKLLIEIIDIDKFSFDSFLRTYLLKNSDIPLKYSGIRNLLLRLEFFSYGNNQNILVINKEYYKELEELVKGKRIKITLEEFKNIQLLKEKIGLEAENFVLEFERKKLKALGRLDTKEIMKISSIDVGAGYDIVSYIDEKSTEYDKFIEVKSFDSTPSFFWTKNEIKVSEYKKENYFLYLVDRNKIFIEDYEPLIICNPYLNVFENSEKWTKESQSWYFILNK